MVIDVTNAGDVRFGSASFTLEAGDMGQFAKTIKHEFAEMIPPTIYFFVILHVVAVVRALMTKGTGIELSASTSIAVAALILGKAVLIANVFPYINRFPEKPLIWNVCWKTALYFLVA